METVNSNVGLGPGELLVIGADTSINWRERAIAAERKLETQELLLSCVKDVLDFWPQMTLRTIRTMIGKMETLRQAMELCK